MERIVRSTRKNPALPLPWFTCQLLSRGFVELTQGVEDGWTPHVSLPSPKNALLTTELMRGSQRHPPDAQWWDDDVEGTEIGSYFPSGREASVSAWLEMNAPGGAPSDLSGGQHAQYLAPQVGDATVDPQQLTLQLNGFAMDFSYQVSGADFGTPFLGGSLENHQLGLADAPNLSTTYPEVDPCPPSGEFIPGAPMFPVALPTDSHVLEN